MNIPWDATAYQKGFSFVPSFGEDVLKLLPDVKGKRVLDVGCGNGLLTAKLCALGADVTGIDASRSMLELAQTNCPAAHFELMDAADFSFAEPFDVVFSNAVFHWVEDQDALLTCVRRALKPGGILVCEFGGYGCAKSVHDVLAQLFSENGLMYDHMFYFPTIGQYTPRMERNGLRPDYAVLFDRPTPQGESGVRGWIEMFLKHQFKDVDKQKKDEIITQAEAQLEAKLCIDGVWMIDYVRIRLRAIAV